MITINNLGIWMDHSNAHLMELTVEPIQTKVFESRFDHAEKELSLEKSENLMHNKEQHDNAAYYKGLIDVIKNYKSVLLFGPTNAKTELYNLIKADHRYENIKVEVQQADKMTENQEHAFVQDYFSKQ